MNRTERLFILLVLTLVALLSVITLILLSLPFFSEAPAFGRFQEHRVFLQTLPLRVYTTAAYALTLIVCGASISLFLRKTNYPEFTFFIFGLLSYASLGSVNLPPLMLIAGYPAPAAVFVLRLFYLFWILAVMFFFLAGLFPNGIPNLKQHTFFLVTVIGAVTIILVTPIDTVHMLESFPHAPPTHELLPWFIRCIALLAVLNLIVAGFRSNSRKYLFAALGIAAVIGGTELFFISELWGTIASIACIIGGTLLYSWMIHKEYLWS